MAEKNRHLADAYAAMMNMDAWKDLEMYVEAEREASMKRIDSKDAKDLVINDVCEERGMRKGMMKIVQHAQFRREGI